MKTIFIELVQALRNSIFKLLVIGSFALLPIIIILYFCLTKEIPIDYFTRDANAISGKPFYYGALSNIGVLLWMAAVTLCFYKCKLLFGKKINNFLRFSGFFTALLLIDDFFMLHEQVIPIYLGVPEVVYFSLYLFLMVYMFINYYKVIFNSDYVYILLAVCFFGLSIFIDLLIGESGISYLLEDSAKFVGIVFWAVYYYYFSPKIENEVRAEGETDKYELVNIIEKAD